MRSLGAGPLKKTTIERINVVRTAASSDTRGDLPVETRPIAGEEVGYTVPGADRFIGSWAPWRRGKEYIFMEAYLIGKQESQVLARYLHEGEETEAFIKNAESEEEVSTRTQGEDVLME